MEKTKGRADATDKLIAKRIKYIRMSRGLSQQELGDFIDVSIQQIQKYEKATNRISAGKLKGLADVLRVPVSYLYEAPLPDDFIDLSNKEMSFKYDKKPVTLDSSFFEKLCKRLSVLQPNAQKNAQDIVLNLLQNLSKMN